MKLDVRVIPQLPDLFIQLAATFILFLVMRHFLYAPVKKLLDERNRYIEEGVKKAEEAEKTIQQSQDIYNQKLLEAKQESSEIISQARAYGEDLKTKAVAESKELAKSEYEKGIAALENERAKTMKSMNDEIADMAMSAAEKVLRQKMNSDTDKDLVKSFINDLEESYE